MRSEFAPGLEIPLLRVEAWEAADELAEAPTRSSWWRILCSYAQRIQIADLAAKHPLPARYGLNGHAEVGDLASYAADFTDLVWLDFPPNW